MHRLIAGGAVVLILLLSIDAAACRADSDCPGASRCVKTFGQREGVCERGTTPIDGERGRQVGDPNRPEGTEGQPCEFGGDCVDGLYCLEQGNSGMRVCRPY